MKRKFLVEVESVRVDEAHSNDFEIQYATKVLEVGDFIDLEDEFSKNGLWIGGGDSIGEVFEETLTAILFEGND